MVWGAGVVGVGLVVVPLGSLLEGDDVEVEVGGSVTGLFKNVVFVGAVAMTCSINSGTRAGVTLSTIVKAGSSSIVVGLSFES